MSGPPRKKNTITIAEFLRQPETRHHNQSNTSNISNNNQDNNNSQPYTIRATKKGTVPCVVEKRKHHKVVVVSNIEGDIHALLSALQKALGTGGVVKDKHTIEIQGDERHDSRVKQFVLTTGCVVGASKTVKALYDEGKKQGHSEAGEGHTQGVQKKKASIDPTVPLDTKTIKAMKPTELKKHLSARQLSTQGNKKELMTRLMAWHVSS